MILLSPEQIGDLLGFDEATVSDFKNPYTPLGRLYRKCLTMRARELHEQTMKLALIGSPTALESANQWLRQAQHSIE